MLALRPTLRLLVWIMLPAYAMVLGTFLLPPQPLDGAVARVAYWVAESGGPHGLPFIALALLLLLATRPGAARAKQRIVELLAVLLVTGVCLGGGAWANEHVLKVAVGVPRPDIIALSKCGALGKTSKQFYALGDKAARSRYLARMLRARARMAPRLDPLIRAHWVAETGYSFPSGHSFVAMMTAAVFLGLGLSLLSGAWRIPFLLVVPWALAVCYSRPILRVHSPTDVSVGAFEGVIVGLIALLAARALLGRIAATSRQSGAAAGQVGARPRN